MSPDQCVLALNSFLRPPQGKPEDSLARREGFKTLSEDFSSRLAIYQNELGANTYVVFNTFTDIAARPPANRLFQKHRHTIEKSAGRWLKELAKVSQRPAFDLNQWLPDWEPEDESRLIPGRTVHALASSNPLGNRNPEVSLVSLKQPQDCVRWFRSYSPVLPSSPTPLHA